MRRAKLRGERVHEGDGEGGGLVALLLDEVGDGEENDLLRRLVGQRGDRHEGRDVARAKKRNNLPLAS